MKDSILISLVIADRVYKVNVSREEEAVFREAAIIIESKMKEYAKAFAYKDKQDLLAMVMIQYLTSYIKLEKETNFLKDDLLNRLEEIDNLLEYELKE